ALSGSSLFLVFRFRRAEVVIVQRIIGLYLIGVCVNQLSLEYVGLSLFGCNLTISYGLICAILIGLGYVVNRHGNEVIKGQSSSVGIKSGLILASWIICGHMFVLWLLLSRYYGYGYERDAGVLGSLSLSILLFVFLWRQLGESRFRQLIGVILTVSSTVVIFTNQ
ncbi:MAG: hypothetical protein ACYSWP_16070, partial [Planctomycetota bacterium]